MICNSREMFNNSNNAWALSFSDVTFSTQRVSHAWGSIFQIWLFYMSIKVKTLNEFVHDLKFVTSRTHNLKADKNHNPNPYPKMYEQIAILF